MALGTRAKAEYNDYNGTEWEVQVLKEGYSSAVTVLTAGAPAHELTWHANGAEIFEPIKGSDFKLHIKNTGSAVDTLLSEIGTAQEQIFYLKVLRDGALYWAGPVLQDLCEFEDTFISHITINATDGLGRLKDISFPASNYPVGTHVLLYDLLVDMLDMCGTAQLWGSTDVYITSNIKWYETQMYTSSPNTATQEPLLLTRCLPDAFVIDKSEPGTLRSIRAYQIEVGMSVKRSQDSEISTCHDVLRNILEIFTGRLHMEYGTWYVLQPGEYVDTTFQIRGIDKVDTIRSTGSFSHQVTVDQSSVVRSGITFDYLPAFKKVTVLHDVVSANLLRAGQQVKQFSHPINHATWALPPLAGSNGSTLKLVGTAYVLMLDSFFTGKTANIRVALDFVVGTGAGQYRLQGFYGQGPNHKGEWVNTTSTSVRYLFWLKDIPNGSEIPFDLVLPEPPWTYETSCSVKLTFETGYYAGGNWYAQATQPEWKTAVNLKVEVMPNGENSSDVYYRAVNGSYPLNSTERELDAVLIADQVTRSAVNGLEVYNSSGNWVGSSGWKIGGSGTSMGILNLLCQEVLSFQRQPCERITGTIYDLGPSVGFRNSLVIGGYIWLPVSMTLTTSHDVTSYSGQWVRIGRNITGITTDSLNNYTPPNSETLKQLGQLQAAVQTLAFAMLESTDFQERMVARLSDDIPGSVATTSLPITTLLNTLIKDDDILTIINANTYEMEDVVLSATPSGGATTLSIDSISLARDYPIGSAILVKRGVVLGGELRMNGPVNFSGLPTDSTGLASGSLYNNSGTVMIVP